MESINNKVWDILKEDERLALSLFYGHQKSTWESGEILNKSHYKYLEIQQRARKFMEMFTQHFQVYDDIIPNWVNIDPTVRIYFNLVIGERMKISQAVKEISDSRFKVSYVRNSLIEEEVMRMSRSRKEHTHRLLNLIRDFDRWNNHRILPTSIQEPSAYKRRNNNADKSNIKNIISLHEFTIKTIVERYKVEEGDDLVYTFIVSNHIKMEESVVAIKNKQSIIDELSKIGLFVFARRERAQELFDLVYSYHIEMKKKDCKLGQKFWPKYRLAVKHSLNHHAIRKKLPSRKYLETALRDLDIQILNPKNKDTNKPGRRRKRVSFD